ncbi:MAG: hypothetical protein ABI361_03170 [Nitrososphaera sp.]
MRLPFSGTDPISKKSKEMVDQILELYSKVLNPVVKMQSAEAMVADGSVIETDTFDPRRVELVYNNLKARLQDEWDSCEISSSDTDDLRRIYCQIIKKIGRHYRLTGYFGVQFHVLPYYRSDKRIPEIKQALARLEESAAKLFVSFSSAADSALEGELRSAGLADLDTEELLVRMFEDEQLRERLDIKNSEVKGAFPELERITSQRDALLSELKDFVLEFYRTTPVLIDSIRLLSGEEGIVAYFDIEWVSPAKGARRRSSGQASDSTRALFDPAKLSESDDRALVSSLQQVSDALEQALADSSSVQS